MSAIEDIDDSLGNGGGGEIIVDTQQNKIENVTDAVVELKVATVEVENNNENGNGQTHDNGDNTDSRSFFARLTSRTTTIDNVGVLKVNFDSLNYSMNGSRRGRCLIINHQHFDPRLQLNSRSGTEIDGKALKHTFEGLGFDVETMGDPTRNEIMLRLEALSREDHSQADCLVVCVLSHGEQSSLWARDCRYRVDEIYQHFTANKCLSLAGKPKLFFVQACQGSQFDRGTTLVRHEDVTDSASCYKIPNWADFLIVYSTVPGHYSWRNPRLGSWFVQALTDVLNRFSDQYDLLSMLTIVNMYVAYNFESVSDMPDFHGNKQVACITSMLTRRLFFGASV